MSKVPVEPGLYPGIPYDVYDSWDALRVSTLKYASSSARHLRWALDGRLEREETDALRLGTAIHRKLLEPEKYEIFMDIAEPCCAELKSGPRKGKCCDNSGTRKLDLGWYCGTHAPPEAVTPAEYVTADEHRMIEELNHEIRLHPVVKILRQQGGCELSGVAVIEGVTMKCRMDKVVEPGGNRSHATVVDIKTKQPMSVSLDECRKQSNKLAYHAQAALYQRMLKKLMGIDEVEVFFLFVEKGAPYDCLVIRLSEWDLAAGNNAFLDWIRIYKEGRETGKWPGASDTFETGLLPDWAYKYYGVNKV